MESLVTWLAKVAGEFLVNRGLGFLMSKAGRWFDGEGKAIDRYILTGWKIEKRRRKGAEQVKQNGSEKAKAIGIVESSALAEAESTDTQTGKTVVRITVNKRTNPDLLVDRTAELLFNRKCEVVWCSHSTRSNVQETRWTVENSRPVASLRTGNSWTFEPDAVSLEWGTSFANREERIRNVAYRLMRVLRGRG